MKNLFKNLLASVLLSVLLVGNAHAGFEFPRFWEELNSTTIQPVEYSAGNQYNVTITGTLTVGSIGLTGDLDMQANDILHVDSIFGSTAILPVRIGDAGTTGHALASEDDLHVTGKLEIDSNLYIDGTVTTKTNIPINWGSGNNASLTYAGAQTPDGLVLGVGAQNNSVLMIEQADVATDFAHALQTNPTLWIQSADETTITDYLSLSHDQTNAVITSGAGALQLNAPDGVVLREDNATALTIRNDGTLTRLFPQTGNYSSFGSAAATSHSLDSNNDLMIEGELEVDGNAFFDAILQTGRFTFAPQDQASFPTWANVDCIGTTAGDQCSYIAKLGGENVFKVYGEQDGSSGIEAQNHSIKFFKRVSENQGTDVASATNLTLGNDGNAFELTGTTKVDLISNIGWEEGAIVTFICNESVTIDHGTATSSTNITILLDGAGDFGCTANDTLQLMLSSTTAGGQAWRQISRSAN